MCRGPLIIFAIDWPITTASFLIGSFALVSTHSSYTKTINMTHRKIIEPYIKLYKKTEREMTRIFTYNFLEDMQKIKEFQE